MSAYARNGKSDGNIRKTHRHRCRLRSDPQLLHIWCHRLRLQWPQHFPTGNEACWASRHQ